MKNSNGISSGTAVVIVATLLISGFLAVYIAKQPEKDTEAGATDHHAVSQSSEKPIELTALAEKKAPSFSFNDKDGKEYSSENLQGKKVILFFNEGLMCYPACWNQIAALAFDDRLRADDLVVLSVIVDSPDSWQKAVEKMPELGRATVVFDTGAVASRAFGMLTTKSSMHYGQFPGHSYVIIDRDGIIRHILDDPSIGIHNDKLVEEIEKLQ